jgi:hypothetical protein
MSWAGALIVAAPYLIRRESFPKMVGMLMFPAMLLGPALSGFLLTRLTDGRDGVRKLGSRMARWHFSARWYAPLLIPPAIVLGVLVALQALVSSSYAANRFLVGVLFALPAGFLEEVGWTGYAFPRMHTPGNSSSQVFC